MPGRGVFVRSDLNHGQLVDEIADTKEESELYRGLLDRVARIDNDQSDLRMAISQIAERVRAIEQQQDAQPADLQ